jgi:hypothetical protein
LFYLNASELFALTKPYLEKGKVRDLLNALKVLRLHSRYGFAIPACMNNIINIPDELFYVLAEQNKLQIVTLNTVKYSGLRVKSVYPQLID